jgi:hypothetical protein
MSSPLKLRLHPASISGSRATSQLAATAKDEQLTPDEIQVCRVAALKDACMAEEEVATTDQARDALKRAAQARA